MSLYSLEWRQGFRSAPTASGTFDARHLHSMQKMPGIKCSTSSQTFALLEFLEQFSLGSDCLCPACLLSWIFSLLEFLLGNSCRPDVDSPVI